MKRIFILIIVVLACIDLSAQKSKVKYKPAGLWNFEAPAAPEGYTTGVIEITKVSKKLSMKMSFSGNDYKYPEDIRFEKDSLQFYLNVDGTDVTFKSKFEQSDKISGIAFTSGGSVPFVLTREKNKTNLRK